MDRLPFRNVDFLYRDRGCYVASNGCVSFSFQRPGNNFAKYLMDVSLKRELGNSIDPGDLMVSESESFGVLGLTEDQRIFALSYFFGDYVAAMDGACESLFMSTARKFLFPYRYRKNLVNSARVLVQRADEDVFRVDYFSKRGFYGSRLNLEVAFHDVSSLNNLVECAELNLFDRDYCGSTILALRKYLRKKAGDACELPERFSELCS